MIKNERIGLCEQDVIKILHDISKNIKILKRNISKKEIEQLDEVIEYNEQFSTKYSFIFDKISYIIMSFDILAKDFCQCVGMIGILINLRHIVNICKAIAKNISHNDYSENDCKIILMVLRPLSDFANKIKNDYSIKTKEEIAEESAMDEIIDRNYRKAEKILIESRNNKQVFSEHELKHIIRITKLLKAIEMCGNYFKKICESILYTKNSKHYNL